MKRAERKRRVNPAMCIDSLIDLEDFNSTDKEGVFQISVEGTKRYISILSISGIDIFHYTSDDMESVFDNFSRSTVSMKLPHKYVFTTSAPYFRQQKDFLKHKTDASSHSFSRELLTKKHKELSGFEEKHKDRLAFLIVFSDDIDELEYSCTSYQRTMTDTDVKLCGSETATEFLNRYLCFGEENVKLTDLRQVSAAVLPERIQFQQNCFRVDDIYVTSLVVSDYPAELLDLEIASIVSSYDDCTVTYDVDFRPKQEVLNEIKFSLRELNSRSAIKQEVSDTIDTQHEFQKLTSIYSDITSGNEQMLYATLRIFVSDQSLSELTKRVRTITDELESRGISVYVPINAMKNEYTGLIRPNNSVQTPYPLQDTYKRQFPFYYQSHTDPSGMFFGYTDTGGLNVFNSFYRNGNIGRNSYDLISIGVKGSGKSVTLKSMLQDQIVIGNKVMVLDIEGEYQDMAKIFDGQIIKLSRKSTINPLQIRSTIDRDTENEDTDSDDIMDNSEVNSANFTSEISRICTFLTQFSPSISDEEISVFRDALIEVYIQKGITENTDVRQLQAVQFPIFSDILAYIRKKMSEDLTEYEHTIYLKLETTVKQLSAGGAYGSMFDTHTNVDVEDKDLIVFDVRVISEMDNNVYNAQLFNILSLMWGEICKNRLKNKKLSDPYDRKYIVALIDEAHRFISAKNTQVTDFIEKLLRRTRKYDAGLWFASQSILDFLPSGNSEQAERIKIIFQLVQYKVILKQSSDSIAALKDIFTQFTLSELQNTTKFKAGEMLMSISSGRHKLHCRRTATPSDLMYIGNSQDRSEVIHRIFSVLYNEYTLAEYGHMLINGGAKAQEDFIKIFTKEVFEQFGLTDTCNDYLHRIVSSSVRDLCRELVDKGRS
ncbi:MAG: DUF87 domain-containing protein [Ruminococcus sp.]|nr:DUF87 domain-containing protein [Ruminococcus sp.]